MNKYLTAILAILISFILVACEGTQYRPLISPELTPSPEVSEEVTPPLEQEKNIDEEIDRTDIQNEERAAIFRNFLTERYSQLSSALYGGIAGVSFIDIDCDGGMEMLLFDAGSSASMGVQFFDIIDGVVECISANITTVRESFGGDHFTETYVNANLFDDFRLMENKETGERFFLVSSWNGALDFYYTELIKFYAEGEVLTLKSLAYMYDEIDEESDEIKNVKYMVRGKNATEKEYTAETNRIFSQVEDVGLEAKGVFAWENETYTDGLEGLLQMVEKALSLADEQIHLC